MHPPFEIGNASRHPDLTIGDESPGESGVEIAATDGPAHLPKGAKAVLSKTDH